jgi:ribosome-associated translation inhibitor RaiA
MHSSAICGANVARSWREQQVLGKQPLTCGRLARRLQNLRGMLIPPQVTFRGISHSDWLEGVIRDRVEQLTKFYDAIGGCRVLVEFAERHHEQGNRFHVRIDLTVPGDEIVVSDNANSHENVEVAVRDAFDLARRQLQGYARKQRGQLKLHTSVR